METKAPPLTVLAATIDTLLIEVDNLNALIHSDDSITDDSLLHAEAAALSKNLTDKLLMWFLATKDTKFK